MREKESERTCSGESAEIKGEVYSEMKLSQSMSYFWLKECYQSEIHPKSGFRASRRESWRQRRLNLAATHPFDVINTAIDCQEIVKRWFSNFSKHLGGFKLRRSKRHF